MLPLTLRDGFNCRKQKNVGETNMSRRPYIREWRIFRGLKQETLARASGISRPTISQLETGKQVYTQNTLEAVADALEVEPGYLLLFNPLEEKRFWTRWLPLRSRPKHDLFPLLRHNPVIQDGDGQKH